MPRRKLTFALSVIAFAFLAVTSSDAEADSMKIRIRINGNEIETTLIDSETTLIDSATSRDFVSLLPLKLTLEDYGETEKIAYLPRKLSTERRLQEANLRLEM
jgi:hypothetical protein